MTIMQFKRRKINDEKAKYLVIVANENELFGLENGAKHSGFNSLRSFVNDGIVELQFSYRIKS